MCKIFQKSIFCFLIVYIIFINNSSAQTDTITRNDQYLKFSIGYGQNGVDSRIGDFPIFNLFYVVNLKNNIFFQTGIEYYQSRTQKPYSFFEYKGDEFTGNYCQFWKNISIDLLSKFSVSDLSYFGFGISLEEIEIEIDKPRDNYPFRPDYNTDQMNYFNEITYDKIIRVGVIVEASLEPSYNWIVEPYFSIRYKMIFCGLNYGKTSMKIQDIFSLSFGLKYHL